MKKILTLILAVMMIVWAVPVVQSSAITAEESLPYLLYRITDGEVMIIDCNMSVTEIVVPDTIEGYPVTSLSTRVFYDCTSLRSVVLPESVRSIGERAFYNCKSLVSVNIPEQITVIETRLFYNCTSLAELSLPKGITEIKEAAFSGCAFESFTVPDGVTVIARSLFSKCSALREITIHDGVTSIGNSAFNSCKSLTSISLPEGLTVIGDSTFMGCSSLSSLKIPEGVETIESYAFFNCTALTSLVLPESLTYIEKYAATGSETLKTLYYAGNEAQWGSITIGENNDIITNAEKVFDYVEDAHTHKEAVIGEIKPTCTENGYTEGKICTECGEVTVAPVEISPLGHSYSEGCCTRCGEIDEEYIPPYSVGDLNDDGLINSQDIFCLKLIVKTLVEPTVSERLAADTNSDGLVNAADAFALSYRVLYGEWA